MSETTLCPLTVTRKKLIAMFEALGIDAANKWSEQRLRQKVKILESILKEDDDVKKAYDELPADVRCLVDEVVETVKAGADLILVPESAVPKAKKTPAKEKTSTGEGKKAAVSKKAEKNSPAPKSSKTKQKTEDKKAAKSGEKNLPPGNSERSKIFACLTKKPKTMKELVAESGVSSTYYDYLNGLAKKGEITKSDNGYALN